MPSISAFCEWMRKACEDWSVGYDQSNRQAVYDGGETDCSALVIWALKKAGFDTGSASYTGDMSVNLTRHGWKRIPFYDLSQVKAGDILLNDTYHTAAVISGSGYTARLAQASIDERGRATGGQSGDQTGNETNIRTVYVYSRGWDCILRYVGSSSGSDEASSNGLEVDGSIGMLTVSEWQRQLGTVVDGCVSGQLKDCQSSYPALAAVTFEGTGSSLMRKVQEVVGVANPTGIIAQGTIRKLQGTLILWGYDIDESEGGVLGESTAMAIQRSLNDGKWANV